MSTHQTVYLLLVFVLFNAGGIVKLANGQGKTWCVAKPSSTESELEDNTNFVCQYLDCKDVQKGGACYEPASYINHASVVMNLYYQAKGRFPWTCSFSNSGLITQTDPRYSLEVDSGYELRDTWCIANPLASNASLKANLDYVCRQVDCSLIIVNGSCFFPDTYIHHASFAMNLYYQFMGRHLEDCDFGNSSLISLSDPSLGSCNYESSGALEEKEALSETWCVAKPTTTEETLQENLDFACNHVDCGPIQEGGTCFNPANLINHAVFAMNLYYQRAGRRSSSCDFKNSGIIVSKNPSTGYSSCTFEHF
ncbi:hypothetical protein Tsubulata_002225 [Turnera subulata]|uniref:X8 domain-containing protein n=1 Tax=Turnera subulata TaxID=218843 RepID=A0A9Q0F7Y7_9ROSI|nr:hypothetical protein Tsubulata_002225 [Turnera subulata]